jgi:hypothetical protein
LKVLIKQIEDKELARIYAFSHKDEPKSAYTQEQIASIDREIKSFEAEAREQIQRLENEGIMAIYEQQNLSTTEQDVLAYLRGFMGR